MSEPKGLLRRLFSSIAQNRPELAPAQVLPPPRSWPEGAGTPPPRRATEATLIDLDHSYAGMYRLHEACHSGIVAEMAARSSERPRRLLEVAPGSGWNAGAFIEAGFDYWGLDISETALSVLLRRYPRARVVNCEIDDADVLADSAFDVVYCSAMLEHLSDHERALRQLIRLARQDLYVMFYEGLPADGPDEFKHFPFDKEEWRQWFGVKFSDYQDRFSGYFIKRYARSTIAAIVRDAGHEARFLDATNRPYIKTETILHVTKS